MSLDRSIEERVLEQVEGLQEVADGKTNGRKEGRKSQLGLT